MFSQEVKNQVDIIRSELESLTSLTALYVHGSIAMDCNGPDSDLDILGVVEDDFLSDESGIGIAKTLLNISNNPYPVEISLLQERSLRLFKHPAPFIFHYSEDWRGRYEAALRGDGPPVEWGAAAYDRDLAAHITITREFGITIKGPDPKDIFWPVPHEAYWDALMYDFGDLKSSADENPVYAILNACRVLAYNNERLITSKKTGGEYGMKHLPQKELICAALSAYIDGKSKKSHESLTPQAVRDFIDFATISMSL